MLALPIERSYTIWTQICAMPGTKTTRQIVADLEPDSCRGTRARLKRKDIDTNRNKSNIKGWMIGQNHHPLLELKTGTAYKIT